MVDCLEPLILSNLKNTGSSFRLFLEGLVLVNHSLNCSVSCVLLLPLVGDVHHSNTRNDAAAAPAEDEPTQQRPKVAIREAARTSVLT